ncbi:hypothetical protein JG687_00009005 [Phytophthora cactorum]|uniref:Uncharacterized protein n=1 Tax=Phytophthora cactorum TaxID=29920 RepID=A0A329RRA0_9STRA|nr:hypothetical protein Pcac1_g16693 [Phytophthora cactorum]KAG3103948.1 hypothetical protein PI125_g13700 [Phytophthora idaei]KAG2813218.1 hypothetical protein PC111_g14481 [Phytophthora cactorum]KAG2814290.1 hypothetical protein PC112_g14364 [Phytophthora cactorum]KAG2866546.1 hypothetical protein PC113_g2716 [Phytophthora cactorum]
MRQKKDACKKRASIDLMLATHRAMFNVLVTKLNRLESLDAPRRELKDAVKELPTKKCKRARSSPSARSRT